MYQKKQDILEMIQVVVGDITATEADALVNSTNPSFSGSGGIDAAIHKAAGTALSFALHGRENLAEGQAVITPAFQIQSAKWIIHTVAPRWQTGFSCEEHLLAKCYANSLQLALDHRCASIAFPCMGVGAKHFPEDRAAEIALNTAYHLLRRLDEDSSIQRIIFVCNNEQRAQIYRKHLKRMILEAFMQSCSPETIFGTHSMERYFAYMTLLAELEWGDPGKYHDYISTFTQTSGPKLPPPHSQYDSYAMKLDTWDYNTCLAYIIFLQRAGYWSGGLEAPHYDQCGNGTIRRILIRMKTMLK